MAGVKGRSGGKRANTVAKVLSDDMRSKFARAMEKKAQETGIAFEELICEEAWHSDNHQKATQARRMIFDSQVVKESYGEKHEHKHGPTVYLPELKPDPAREDAH